MAITRFRHLTINELGILSDALAELPPYRGENYREGDKETLRQMLANEVSEEWRRQLAIDEEAKERSR